MNITQQQYTDEIESLASQIVEDATEIHKDDGGSDLDDHISDYLHETIDGHQWVIYYAYHQQVLDNSDNYEAYKDIYDNESLGEVVTEKGVNGLTTIMAFWALYADVSDKLAEMG